MILLIGAACSGKNTILEGIMKHPKFKDYQHVLEYTTRPIRPNESGDEYHFVDETKYMEMNSNGEFNSQFRVDTNAGVWYYSFKGTEILPLSIAITNPTNLRQLVSKGNDILSIYLDVSQRERLLRMLKRGDNISEAYRRSVHDEGHFSGVKEECTFSVNCERSPDEIVDEIYSLLHKA